MKKFIFLSMVALASISFVSCEAQSKKSPHETVSSDNVSVTYGRPYAKGREIFGALEKYDKVWRVGADEATEITFKKDAVFGGENVKAGTYTLFAIPTETEWTIILNSELKQWGAFKYEKIKGENKAEIKTPVIKIDNKVEQLTITPTDKQLSISWDNTAVVIPIGWQ